VGGFGRAEFSKGREMTCENQTRDMTGCGGRFDGPGPVRGCYLRVRIMAANLKGKR